MVKVLIMKTINRILSRLHAECIWARLDLFTRLSYYKRKPLVAYESSANGGVILNSVI